MKFVILFLVSINCFALDCNKVYSPQKRKYTQEKDIKVHISSEVFKKNHFLFFDKEGTYGKYVTLDIPFSPVEKVFNSLKKIHPRLKNRGEAHITILSPVEYQCIFRKQGISISEIEKKIETLQLPQFEILSIGNGYKDLDETFFIIVKSQDILDIRKEIASLLGDPTQFNYKKYYPHITLGFTSRDLHESDGVFKNEMFSKDSRFKVIVK